MFSISFVTRGPAQFSSSIFPGLPFAADVPAKTFLVALHIPHQIQLQQCDTKCKTLFSWNCSFEPCVVNKERENQTEQKNSIASRSWGRSEPLAYWLHSKYKMRIKICFSLSSKWTRWATAERQTWHICFPRTICQVWEQEDRVKRWCLITTLQWSPFLTIKWHHFCFSSVQIYRSSLFPRPSRERRTVGKKSRFEITVLSLQTSLWEASGPSSCRHQLLAVQMAGDRNGGHFLHNPTLHQSSFCPQGPLVHPRHTEGWTGEIQKNCSWPLWPGHYLYNYYFKIIITLIKGLYKNHPSVSFLFVL